MKAIKFLLIATSLLLVAACAKESKTTDSEIIDEESVIEPTKTITFSANIDFEKVSKATLSTLNIHWEAGDYIGIVSDKGGSVVGYEVIPDGEDPTKCSFTITPVDGATTYYAIFTGSSDFSGISFDETTKTFSGTANKKLSIGEDAYGKNSLSGVGLSMAGKTSSKSITMKPCLALVHLKIAAASVASKYADGYPGVRGLYFYQKGAYSSGDYTVNLSGTSPLTQVDNAYSGRIDFRQINEGTSLMTSGADYYMSVIPGGSIPGLRIRFFGFNSDESPAWDPYPYVMELNQSLTAESGDYFDLGTLDPVGMKKAADAAAAAAPIQIDGDFADWASIETVATGSRLAAVKALSDGTNLYLYQKWNNSDCHYESWSSYQFLYFDTDNNAETGSTSSSDYRKGTELYWKFFFHFELSNASYNGYKLSEYCVWDGTAFTAGTFAAGQVFRGAESADYYECEYSIPLANLSLTAGSKCKIGILGYTRDTSDASKEFRNALFEVQL